MLINDRRSVKMHPSLEEFIRLKLLPNSQQIEDPDWNRLYCRWGPRTVRVHVGRQEHYKDFNNVIVLANIEAKVPGVGTFRKLLQRIQAVTDAPIYVECVTNNHFEYGLQCMGFTQVDIAPYGNPNYLLMKD